MNTKLDRLTQITDYWTPKILIAILAAAFILSYAALLTLATAAGYDWRLAWLWPLLLDGVVIFSTMSLVKRQFAGQKTGYVWFLLIVSDGLSIGLNGYAAYPNWAYVAIHAAPPLVLVLLLKAYTNDAKDDAKQAQAVATLDELRQQVDNQTQLLRSLEADEAAKIEYYAAKIQHQESRLATLQEATKAAKTAPMRGSSTANGAKSPLNGASLDDANEAKQQRIDARRALVASLWQQGLTQADIAKQVKAAGFKGSIDTIRRDLKALGLGDGPEVVDIFRTVMTDLAVATNGNGGSHASD